MQFTPHDGGRRQRERQSDDKSEREEKPGRLEQSLHFRPSDERTEDPSHAGYEHTGHHDVVQRQPPPPPSSDKGPSQFSSGECVQSKGAHDTAGQDQHRQADQRSQIWFTHCFEILLINRCGILRILCGYGQAGGWAGWQVGRLAGGQAGCTGRPPGGVEGGGWPAGLCSGVLGARRVRCGVEWARRVEWWCGG